MDLGLTDRVAIVFAASRGLGLACARALAEEGCHLAICSRRALAIEQAGREIAERTGRRVLTRAVDVTRGEQISAFVAEAAAAYGRIDVLVNNSGGPPPGPFDALDEAQFSQACELLLLNVVRATKAALPTLRAGRRGGRIITITSTATREVLPNLMLSNSVRAAVAGWSKTLARELAPEGITVNCVAPGTIGTERIDELVAASAARQGRPADEIRAQLLGRIPTGRFGSPEEFAAAVAFLASARASFITGTTVYVDGGQTATVL